MWRALKSVTPKVAANRESDCTVLRPLRSVPVVRTLALQYYDGQLRTHRFLVPLAAVLARRLRGCATASPSALSAAAAGSSATSLAAEAAVLFFTGALRVAVTSWRASEAAPPSLATTICSWFLGAAARCSRARPGTPRGMGLRHLQQEQ